MASWVAPRRRKNAAVSHGAGRVRKESWSSHPFGQWGALAPMATDSPAMMAMSMTAWSWLRGRALLAHVLHHWRPPRLRGGRQGRRRDQLRLALRDDPLGEAEEGGPVLRGGGALAPLVLGLATSPLSLHRVPCAHRIAVRMSAKPFKPSGVDAITEPDALWVLDRMQQAPVEIDTPELRATVKTTFHRPSPAASADAQSDAPVCEVRAEARAASR